jgi:hypothetical protein
MNLLLIERGERCVQTCEDFRDIVLFYNGDGQGNGGGGGLGYGDGDEWGFGVSGNGHGSSLLGDDNGGGWSSTTVRMDDLLLIAESVGPRVLFVGGV